MTAGQRMAGPVAAGMAVGAWVAIFRAYGIFDVADEGALLAQAWRAAHGQVPYVDFATGYGPLYFQLQAWLVAAGGLAAVRWALVAAHGLTAALLYALVRRVSGPALGGLAVILELAFLLPIAPVQGAPFNIPYPAWYAGVATLGTALLLGTPRASTAFAAGLLAGATCAMKPNSGLLLAAGTAAALVVSGSARAGPLGFAILGLVAVSGAALVAPTGLTVAAWALLPPTVGLAALGVERGTRDADVLPRLAALAAGFLLVAGACYARPLAVLGPARFAREAFLIGAGVAEIYVQPLGWPVALAGAVGLLAFLLTDRWRAPALAAGGVAVFGLAFAGGAGSASGPTALLRGAEEAAVALVPLAVWGGLAALRGGANDTLAAPAAVAVTAALQLYPRPDFLHLMAVGPALLPLALHLWRQSVAFVPLRPALTTIVVVGLPLVVAAMRIAPAAIVASDVVHGRVSEVVIGDATLVIEPPGEPPLHALASAVATIGGLTNPGDRVISFPACSIVPFFANRLPAGPHDYFFPGRPDRAEAAVLAVRLGASPPRLAVTCAAAGTDLARAWDYFPEFAGLIAARYRTLRVLPPFIVHEVRP